MLDSIFDAISKIIEFLNTIWEFITDFLKDTFSMIKLVGETVAQIPDYLSFLPAEIVAVFVSIFSVVVIYKILGRE